MTNKNKEWTALNVKEFLKRNTWKSGPVNYGFTKTSIKLDGVGQWQYDIQTHDDGKIIMQTDWYKHLLHVVINEDESIVSLTSSMKGDERNFTVVLEKVESGSTGFFKI